jgi:hypothetical protein
MTGNPYTTKLLVDILTELAKDNEELQVLIRELKRIMERDTRAFAKLNDKTLPPWEDWA